MTLSRQAYLSKILLHLFLGIIGLMMIYPFIWMLFSSFKANIDIIQQPFSFSFERLTTAHYYLVADRLNIGRAYFNSLLVSIICTSFILLTSTTAGYVFAKFTFPGKEVLFFIVLGILMLPEYVTIIPLYLLITRLGLLNSYAGLALPFLVDAFGVFLMRQFISGIPDSLIESARLDGAKEITIFSRIIVPLSKSSISVLGILVFLWSWDRFLWPMVITQSQNMRTLPVLMAFFNQSEADMPGASMAASTIMVIPVIIVYAFFQRNFIKGMAMSGLKY